MRCVEVYPLSYSSFLWSERWRSGLRGVVTYLMYTLLCIFCLIAPTPRRGVLQISKLSKVSAAASPVLQVHIPCAEMSIERALTADNTGIGCGEPYLTSRWPSCIFCVTQQALTTAVDSDR